MADFDISYGLTSGHEGYYVSEDWWRSHGNQKSGETYMGIDRIQNPGWAGWAIIDRYKATNGPIAYNTQLPQSLGLEALVKEYAKENYWDTIQGDQIQDQDVANMIYEQKWGGYGGIQRVQEVINGMIAPDSIPVDGVVGADTLSQINALPPNDLYQALYNDRANWITTVGAAVEPTAVTGWMDRLQTFSKTLSDETASVASDVATTATDATQATVAAVKSNPTLIFVAALLLVIGGSALAYYILYIKAPALKQSYDTQ